MLEATLTGGAGAGKSYPDSGPGPKVLKFGSTELGYFGEASSSEMFTLSELRQQTSFYDGTDNAPLPSWIKMFLGGKIIYFPTQVLANPVSWAQLYAKGLVYGVDGPGTFPGTPAVNQLVYVFKDKFSFKVRCFETHPDDPANQGGIDTIATSAILKTAEWGKVISALIAPRQSGYTGDNWALYNLNSFLLPGTGVAIGKNTRQADSTQCLGMNNTQVALVGKALAGYRWLPLLELTPADTPVYFPIKEQAAATRGKALPVVSNAPSYEDSLIAYRLFSSGVQMGRAINAGTVEYSDPYYRIDVSGIKMASNPGLPLVISSVTYE